MHMGFGNQIQARRKNIRFFREHIKNDDVISRSTPNPPRVGIRYENIAHFSRSGILSFILHKQFVYVMVTNYFSPFSNTISVTFKNRINLLWNLTIFSVLLFLASIEAVICSTIIVIPQTFHVGEILNMRLQCAISRLENHNYGFKGCNELLHFMLWGKSCLDCQVSERTRYNEVCTANIFARETQFE